MSENEKRDLKKIQEIEIMVAKILARQFYSGWKYKHPLPETFSEYLGESLHNWIGAARGVICIVEGKEFKEK